MPLSINLSLSTRFKLVLALWLGAEALAFVLVAHLIGFPEALLLGILTRLQTQSGPPDDRRCEGDS